MTESAGYRYSKEAGVLEVLTAVTLLLFTLQSAPGLTNGLALTPPMGYNTWYSHGPNIDENLIKSVADAMATNGLRDAGYTYVCLDDGWAGYRDATGQIVADTNKFPSGMKALADYVHTKGLKIGLYSTYGQLTCAGFPGSCGHVVQDADTYAGWGIDYLKYEGCSSCTPPDDPRQQAELMSAALLNSGRQILFNISVTGAAEPWMPAAANSWRGTGDNTPFFLSVLHHLDIAAAAPFLAGPGQWNDPDVLQVNSVSLSQDEQRANYSMWCIIAAPLLVSGFDSSMPLLTNSEVIAVDQDPAGIQGVCVSTNGDLEVWCKPLANDSNTCAVALLNRGTNTALITASWDDLGLRNGPAAVRDLWARAFAGNFTNSYSDIVASHAARLVKITRGVTVPLPPGGTNQLSGLNWLSTTVNTNANPIQLDQNSAGGPLQMGGVVFARGLGTTPYSSVDYLLGGVASRFQAKVGVDDAACCGSVAVVFRVRADGVKLYDSGTMTTNSPAQSLDLDISGRNVLTLETVDAGGSATNELADWAGAQIIVPGQAPAVPASLSATADTSVSLDWWAVPGSSSYNVKRSTNSGGPYQVIATTSLPGYADSSVTEDTTYFYVVSAVNGYGESANSAEVSIVSAAFWTNTLTATAQSWNNSQNWTNTAFFPNAVARPAIITASLPADQTISLTQDAIVGALTIGAPDGSGASILAAGGGTLWFDNGAAPATITQPAGSKGNILAVPINVRSDLIIINRATNPLTVLGITASTGMVTVAKGALRIGNSTPFTVTSGVTVQKRAALDLNGFDLGMQAVMVSGGGADGSGVLLSGATGGVAAVRNVTLSGDTTFAGTGDWALGGLNLVTAFGSLSSGGQAFNLTKLGTNTVTLRSVQVDPALGNIDVRQGVLSFENATTSIGQSTDVLTVWPSAGLAFRNVSNALAKTLVLNGDGVTSTLTNIEGSNCLAGSVTINGACLLNSAAGTLVLPGGVGGPGGLVKTGAGTIAIGGASSFAGNTLIQAGTLAIINSGSLGAGTNLNIAPGALLDVTGRFGGSLSLTQGCTLTGSGAVRGDFVVDTGAALAPGPGMTTMTFSNNLRLNSDSTTVLKFSKGQGTNDQVQVLGGLTYGGTLVLVNTSSNSLAAGDSLQLFNAASYHGAFQIINPALGPGLVWDTRGLTTNGVLRVVAAQLPLFNIPLLVGNELIFSGTGGQLAVAGAPYYVLSSTNVALPLAAWTPVATNFLDSSGDFMFTNSWSSGSPATFYRLQLP
jgi:alpha-galactosidase